MNKIEVIRRESGVNIADKEAWLAVESLQLLGTLALMSLLFACQSWCAGQWSNYANGIVIVCGRTGGFMTTLDYVICQLVK